jgi:hypothetical protein
MQINEGDEETIGAHQKQFVPTVQVQIPSWEFHHWQQQ